MTDLKYIGETGTHYIVELTDEEGFIGRGAIRKARLSEYEDLLKT